MPQPVVASPRPASPGPRGRAAAVAAVALLVAASAPPTLAQTPAQWTEWGERVHGGFGSLVAYGIGIGSDALVRWGAPRRQIEVEYQDGPAAPCACVLDGIAIAVSASLGQRTLALADGRTEPGLLGRARLTDRRTGRTLIYELPAEAMATMAAINRDTPAEARYEAVMRLPADALFRVRETVR